MKYQFGEFAADFKELYLSLVFTAPVEFYRSPKVYLVPPGSTIGGEPTQITASVNAVEAVYNPALGMTQLCIIFDTPDIDQDFKPYAVILQDPFRSRHSRKFLRGLTTHLTGGIPDFVLNVGTADGDIADDLIGTFNPEMHNFQRGVGTSI